MREQQLAANAKRLQIDVTTRNGRILALRDEEQDAQARHTLAFELTRGFGPFRLTREFTQTQT